MHRRRGTPWQFIWGLAVALGLPAALSAQSARAPSQPALPTPAHCPAPDPQGLLVRFFDVGQGDATLLSTNDGRHVLVDGGPSGMRLLEYLTTLGVDSITLMVATHHHLDHIGGLPAILDAKRVANVVENGVPTTTRIYSTFIAALERSGARVLRAEPRELGVGSMQVRILPPWTRNRTQNLASVGMVASYGAFRVLLTGDAEERALDWWTSQSMIPAVSVVKVGHHGSRNATTPALVAAARPRLAVVSVGAGNSYRHPDAAVLSSWSAVQARVLRTDLHGTVAVRGCTDGSFTVASTRSDDGRR